jgi:hypothetical protein
MVVSAGELAVLVAERREKQHAWSRGGGTSDGDIDTAIDTVTWKKSYGVAVPPYRNLANTQTST